MMSDERTENDDEDGSWILCAISGCIILNHMICYFLPNRTAIGRLLTREIHTSSAGAFEFRTHWYTRTKPKVGC